MKKVTVEYILKDLQLADSLRRLNRTQELKIVSDNILASIEKFCNSKKIVYNEHWIKVRNLCIDLGIDTTQLEIELSFAQQ